MSRDVMKEIEIEVGANPVVLYMKGTQDMPMCGFSARAVAILKDLAVDFKDVKASLTGIDNGDLTKSELHHKVYDLDTGREKLSLKGHGGQVTSVAFSPDDARVRPSGEKATRSTHPTCGSSCPTRRNVTVSHT